VAAGVSNASRHTESDPHHRTGTKPQKGHAGRYVPLSRLLPHGGAVALTDVFSACIL